MPTHHSRLDSSRCSRTRHTVWWLVATILSVAACTPDRATAPAIGPRHPAGRSADVAADDAEQLLFQQPPLAGTNLYTGECCDQVAAADFVVPPGGNWTTSRFVWVGFGPPSPPGIGDFQVNVFRDDGTGRPGAIIVSGISAVPDPVPNPCCAAGEVFDYSRPMVLELGPGRYWVTVRFDLAGTGLFRPQLAPAIGHPGMVGELGIEPFVPISVAPPNNDFAFSVYGSIETPAEAAADLLTTIEGFALPDGTETSLTVKLSAAQAALDGGDTAAACRALQDLINAVSAQAEKKLTAAQATEIIDEATRIRGIIGC